MGDVQVSVVTVVLNNVEGIADTMLSVLNQTYPEFEYIIKDGQSTDGTQKVIQEISDKFVGKTVKLISCSDTGIYDAMNQAVFYCAGKWIIFINSGDSFYDKTVLKGVFNDKIQYQDKGLLYGDAVMHDESGDAVWKADLAKINRKMPFCHQSVFVRRELLLRYPFNKNYKIAADYNHILDLYQFNENFHNLNRIISVFEMDGVSSIEPVKRLKERNSVLSMHGLIHWYNIVLFPLEVCFSYARVFVELYVPAKMRVGLKKWYKKNVKKYK